MGVTISFQYAVLDSVNLIRRLRLAGFAGHITCGWHIPTFCYRELLGDFKEIDSVVRHEGEATLVELLDRLASNTPLMGVPGLAVRDEKGDVVSSVRPLVADLDILAPPIRPNLPIAIGGVPIGFLLTSRGCVGECHYCSIRAFTHSGEGARYRLRDPEQVALEIADIHRRRGARVFFIQDDLFVLPNKKLTIERMTTLQAALERQGVTDIALWIKGRPESIDLDVMRTAKAMGAIHLFLGIENAVDARLEYLGRRHRHADNLHALGCCEEMGIRASFNLMIMDPDCRLEEVEQTISFAEQCPTHPWNLCRTEIYSGTHLLARLAREGRLEGDYLTYGYTMRDKRAELLFRILRVSLHEHAYSFESLLNKLISVSFARQIHERFFPGSTAEKLSREVDALIADSHRGTTDAVREAISFVKRADPTDFDGVRAFATDQALRLGADDVVRFDIFEQLWNCLCSCGETMFRNRMRTKCG